MHVAAAARRAPRRDAVPRQPGRIDDDPTRPVGDRHRPRNAHAGRDDLLRADPRARPARRRSARPPRPARPTPRHRRRCRAPLGEDRRGQIGDARRAHVPVTERDAERRARRRRQPQQHRRPPRARERPPDPLWSAAISPRVCRSEIRLVDRRPRRGRPTRPASDGSGSAARSASTTRSRFASRRRSSGRRSTRCSSHRLTLLRPRCDVRRLASAARSARRLAAVDASLNLHQISIRSSRGRIIGASSASP